MFFIIVCKTLKCTRPLGFTFKKCQKNCISFYHLVHFFHYGNNNNYYFLLSHTRRICKIRQVSLMTICLDKATIDKTARKISQCQSSRAPCRHRSRFACWQMCLIRSLVIRLLSDSSNLLYRNGHKNASLSLTFIAN